MAKERLSMRKIKEAYNSTSIINDPPDKLWEWGTSYIPPVKRKK